MGKSSSIELVCLPIFGIIVSRKSGFYGGVPCGFFILRNVVVSLGSRVGSGVGRVFIDLSWVVSSGVGNRCRRNVAGDSLVRNRNVGWDVFGVSDGRCSDGCWSCVQFEQQSSRFMGFAKRCGVVLGTSIGRRCLRLG
jgi:hypothetical protein